MTIIMIIFRYIILMIEDEGVAQHLKGIVQTFEFRSQRFSESINLLADAPHLELRR